MKKIVAILCVLVCGCSTYERSYTFRFTDAQGRSAEAGVHLKPVKGFAK